MIGGIVSLIIQASLLILALTKGITLFTRGDNKISSYAVNVDLAEEPVVNYNTTKMTTYHVLRKQLLSDGPVYLNESNSRYIDVFFS